MKKIYVVVPFFDYEGYGQPELAFTNKKKAEAMRAFLAKSGTKYESIEIKLNPSARR